MRDLKEKWIGLIKTKKGKGILLGVVIIILVISVGVLYINNDKTLQLNKETVEVEYGKTYNPSLKEIVKDYGDFNSKDLKLESTIKNEEGKEYPSVGKYEVKVTYKKQEVTQKVEVKDTTKPELTVPENIEILQGTDLSTFDFKSLLNATDLSELKDYEIDYSKVDANTVGEYEVNVSIQDKYENKTDAKVKATVIEKPTINDDEVVVQEVVTNEDGTKTVKNSVKKQAEATDKKVVSNSNNTNKNTANSSTTTGGSTSTSGNTSSSNKNNSSSSSSNSSNSNNGSSSSKPSSGSSNSNNSGSSSSNSGSSSTGGSTSTSHTHIAVGNSGKWVNSYSEVDKAFSEIGTYWENKLDSGKIDFQTYCRKCPIGYTDVHSCTCGKITWDWQYN